MKLCRHTIDVFEVADKELNVMFIVQHLRESKGTIERDEMYKIAIKKISWASYELILSGNITQKT